MAKNKQAAEKPEGYYSEERREMLEFIPAGIKKLLDVGCGEGKFSGMIKQERGIEAWGIEPDKNAAKKAGRVLDRVINSGFSGAAGRLPAGYFDCVVFNDILEHLQDPYSAVREIKSRIADNGVVVCSLPNVLHISVLRRLLWNKDWKYEDFGVLDITHLRFFTKKSMVRMFTEQGYEVISIKGINPTRSIRFMIFNILTLGFFRDSDFLQFALTARPAKKGSGKIG
jgi:2-polyprenyl-3-methyl-5-hydroxy-6-metoxy-1,4-benzoquinol methylase